VVVLTDVASSCHLHVSLQSVTVMCACSHESYFSEYEHCLFRVSSDSCSNDEMYIRSYSFSMKRHFVLQYLQQMKTWFVNVCLLGVFKLGVLENCFCMKLIFPSCILYMFCIIGHIAGCLIIWSLCCCCCIWKMEYHP
jgi:hypothetical protein